LSLSRTIAENKTAYYKAFDVVERPLNGSEATPFVAMILDLVEQAQDAVLSDLAEKRVQLDDLKRAIDGLDDTFTERAKDILFYAAQMHIFGAFGESTLDGVSGYLDVTKNYVGTAAPHPPRRGGVPLHPPRPQRQPGADPLAAQGQKTRRADRA